MSVVGGFALQAVAYKKIIFLSEVMLNEFSVKLNFLIQMSYPQCHPKLINIFNKFNLYHEVRFVFCFVPRL